ncbi:MAG: hypothetical protein R2752_05775 [Vicinamibacterales bacterium]
MSIRHRVIPVVSAAALVAVAGCEFKRTSNSLSPSATPAASASTAPSLRGVWLSLDSGDGGAYGTASVRPQAVSLPSLAGCADFRWDVQSQTDTFATGPFAVTCAGPMNLTGTGTGEVLSPTSVKLSVTGSADVPGLGACSFALNGTAELVDDTLRIPFSGQTCLGPVSGSTRLHREDVLPPSAPPPATPPPAPDPEPPAPAPSPSNPCASSNGEFVVECIEDRYPERRQAGVSLAQRIADMEFLRDRVIEAGRCGGLDLAWNLKRGVGPHSTDALAWRHSNGFVDVVDIGAAFDDTSQPLNLQWIIVSGPPGYDGYPSGGCQ